MYQVNLWIVSAPASVACRLLPAKKFSRIPHCKSTGRAAVRQPASGAFFRFSRGRLPCSPMIHVILKKQPRAFHRLLQASVPSSPEKPYRASRKKRQLTSISCLRAAGHTPHPFLFTAVVSSPCPPCAGISHRSAQSSPRGSTHARCPPRMRQPRELRASRHRAAR